MYEGHLQPSAPHSGVTGQLPQPSQTIRPKIGLFDSGVGGLSVLRALQREIPWAEYTYLGDTARLPYGQRSPETIIKYSMQASQFLHDSGVESIVIACNTASSIALGNVQLAFTDTVIHGVVEAGAQAAVNASQTGRIAIIGTAGTVSSRAYEKAITTLMPGAEVHAHACPFLVSLAEEGWTDCDIALMAVEQYLLPLIEEFGKTGPDCIILGCTHFSRFSNVIHRMLGTDISLIDPADSLAKKMAATFRPPTTESTHSNSISFYATDALQRFSRVGSLFLGNSIPTDALERVDLDNL